MPPIDVIPNLEKVAISNHLQALILSLRDTKDAPEILYHYTDAAGLKGIIETATLRATHVSFMNDSSEYMHANEMLRRSVTMAKASSPGALATDVLCEMEDQLSATTPENAWPYFITCFSAKENDLNQWRAYGRGEGGFAIGFASAKLIPKQSLTYLAPAIYDEGLKSMLVDEFVRWIIQEYPKRASLSAAAQRNEHRKNWVEWLLYIAAVAAPIMKNPSFAEEEEWRLVSPSEDRSLMCFLPKLTGLVPYIEFSYEKLPIRILWSGPGRMTRQSLQAGRALLEKHSYPDVNLKSSDIPYRVG